MAGKIKNASGDALKWLHTRARWGVVTNARQMDSSQVEKLTYS